MGKCILKFLFIQLLLFFLLPFVCLFVLLLLFLFVFVLFFYINLLNHGNNLRAKKKEQCHKFLSEIIVKIMS